MSGIIDPNTNRPLTNEELKTIKEDFTKFERSSIRWSRAQAIATIVTFVFIGLQWLAMRSGGKDTHDLAVAAGKQADAAKAQSGQSMQQTAIMSQSLSKTDQLIRQLTGLALEAKRSADAANSTARTAKDELKASQAPSLTMQLRISDFEVGKSFIVEIVITNNGKGPANTLTFDGLALLSSSNPGKLFVKELSQALPLSISPGAAVTRIVHWPIVLTQDDMNNIQSENIRLVTFGKISYSDVSGNTYPPKDYCYFYDPKFRTANAQFLYCRRDILERITF